MADKKKPDLSGKDKDLWSQVTETVRPLKDRPAGKPIPPRRMVTRSDDDGRLPAEWHSAGKAPAPRTQLDLKTRRKIVKGRTDVDRSVDLHGLTQSEARAKLQSVIEGSVARGEKLLLVVTGKGGRRHSQLAPDTPVAYRTRDSFEQFGGVLKRMVPMWLEGPELRVFVESYGPASQEHGGDGALYVLLRRRAPGSKKGRQA